MARSRVIRFTFGRLDRSLETGRILPYLVGVISVIALAFALVMRIVDDEDYPTFGRALWWSVQTVTTVGYGDVTPVSPAGRAVAAGLMVIGFASLSLVTGIIASGLIARRSSTHEEIAAALDALERIEQRLERLERATPGR